jgi:prepilin-type N-terminal cleavage/methylation domain-containing protein
MKFEVRNSEFEVRVPRSAFRAAFTLIELLTVMAVVGILATLLGAMIIHFAKPDRSIAANRQMLDDCARARQLAISQRTTVYMVFIPANFWNDSMNPGGLSPLAWGQLGPFNFPGDAVRTSMTVTQMYAAQWNGYMMVSLRSVGDQPGQPVPKDLVSVKTLPQNSFIAPFKFTAPAFGSLTSPTYPANRPDLPIYGFLKTNMIPFPTADVLENPGYAAAFQLNGGIWMPYIAFNYLGQLVRGDGTLLPYDENIPLSYGSIVHAHDAKKNPIQGLPNATEAPPGSSTSISYNVIHIDRLTGRARLERQEVL